MNKMNMIKRITLGLAVIIILVIVNGTYTFWSNSQVKSDVSYVINNNLGRQEAINSIRQNVALLRMPMLVLMTTSDQADVNKQLPLKQQFKTTLLDELTTLESKLQVPADQQRMATLIDKTENWIKVSENLIDQNLDASASVLYSKAQGAAAFGEVDKAIETMFADYSRRMDERVEAMTGLLASVQRNSTIATILVTITSLLVGFIIISTMRKAFSEYMARMNGAAEQTAAASGQVSESSHNLLKVAVNKQDLLKKFQPHLKKWLP